jgi:predicted ATPase/DNA-binding SARP family transcriptional activator
MMVDVLGPVAVRGGGTVIAGHALGGRRARMVLVALALADGQVPAERLGRIVWGDELPPTWPVALRGVIRGLRAACAPAGGGEQQLIVTVPSGYQLADDVQTDVVTAAQEVTRAAQLLREGRYRAVVEVTEQITRIAGHQLLSGEDSDWIDPYRYRVDATALRAVLLLVEACGQLSDHHRAIETTRRVLAEHPLEESLHRALIAALDRAGDRPGAVQAYEQCRMVLGDQLGIDPSPETVGVYLTAVRGQAASAVTPVPVPTTSFIGRQPESRELTAALARPGLVTVTGPGGVGKSRLAAKVAAAVRTEFDGGRLWVPVAPVADDAVVASSVALTLGVALGTDDPAAAIGDYLAPLGRVLLILDGCEPVVDGAASLAAALLGRAPLLTLLTTSRVPLSVDGETVLPLAPLPAPETGGRLDRNGQVQLLADRVREAGSTLPLDDTVAPHLIALCQRCGGLPLALELVAAQLTVMPAGDLVEHLAEISSVHEDALRSIARNSYLQLDDEEAAVFRRLAVLDGATGLPLVRQVVSGGAVKPIRVVRILRELTARSLLTVDRAGAHWRYRQDDDLRRFAGELLVEYDEEQAAYQRLGDAVRLRLPEDARTAPGAFRDEITAILGSIRSLFAAGLSRGADVGNCQEIAFRLHRYFATTSLHEGRFWLDRLLAASPSGPWAPYATYALGYLSYWSGDTELAMRELEAAVAQLDGSRDSYRARALIFLAGLLDDTDRGTEAIEHVRLSIEAAATHDVDLQCSAAMGMGSVLAERTDRDAARYAHEAIALCRRSGSVEQLAIAMPTAAMICWQVGDLDSARRYVAEALPLNTGPARIARVVLLSAAAGVALAEGDIDAALDYGGTANREASELGVDREMPLLRAVLARAMLAQGKHADAAGHAAAALQAALAMSIESPLAVGLETAALVLHEAGIAADPGGESFLRDLLAAAASIRHQGDRPSPVTLAPAVNQLIARLSDDVPANSPTPRDCARRACQLLAEDRRSPAQLANGPGNGNADPCD